ncbi:hypothetical protein [Tenacibaculum soleae]|uniref:hypothetical protein n=1 Tax=Tenacibaculum soleae TaxID=447689 RepID=UPI003AB90DF0
MDLVDKLGDYPHKKNRKYLIINSTINVLNDNIFGDRNLICSCNPIEDYID